MDESSDFIIEPPSQFHDTCTFWDHVISDQSLWFNGCNSCWMKVLIWHNILYKYYVNTLFYVIFKSNKYQRNYIKWYSQRQMKLLKWFPNCLSLCSSKSLHRIRLDTWTIQHGIIFELEPDSWTNIVVIMKEIIDILNQAQQRDFKKRMLTHWYARQG